MKYTVYKEGKKLTFRGFERFSYDFKRIDKASHIVHAGEDVWLMDRGNFGELRRYYRQTHQPVPKFKVIKR